MDAKFIIYLLCLLILTGQPESEKQIQENIAGEIIRLHVIANSDSDEDQALKLKVKDEIVLVLREQLGDTKNIQDAREIIQANLPLIEKIALRVIKKEGYYYTAKASLGLCDFPIKQYGDMTFPAGQYEALRVTLGKSEGKNWWCVMFPSLCYVDETYDVITEENKEQFKTILTEEEYESLLSGESKPVFHKSGLKPLIDKIVDYFSIKV